MLHPPGAKPRFLIGNIDVEGSPPLARISRWAADYWDTFTTVQPGCLSTF
jgi:hypothetical protein